MRWKVAGAAAACTCIAAAALIPGAPLHSPAERLQRLARVASAVASAVADERYTQWAQGARTEALDERQAQRLHALATANGFLFHKLGQYASAHPNTPATYRKTLATLQDRMPAQLGLDLPALLSAELGAPFAAHFAAIEQQPMACASIAQVHKAWLRCGTPVAVKVQHAALQRVAAADIAIMEGLFLLLHYFYPDTAYMRASWPEWRATLLRELDFGAEASNAARVAAHFAGTPCIAVPRVVAAASGRRVLTMEWVAGCTLRELLEAPPGSEAEAAERRAIGLAAGNFFAQQTLVHGYVHCDPHPANLMVRRCPATGAWQLVVIDHGMYKQLSPTFRRAFCALWRALLVQDEGGALAATRRLGLLDGDAEALSQVLTFRSMKGGARLGADKSRAEWERLKKEWEWVTPADVNAFALRMPVDISFVMRTMSLTRGINRSLGGQTRDRLACWGHAASMGLRLGEALGVEGVALGAAPKPQALPPPGASQVLAALWAALTSALAPLQQQQQQQQALLRGALGITPTESELLAARTAFRWEHATAAGALLQATQAAARRATAWWDWVALDAMLGVLDLLAPAPQPQEAGARPPPAAF